MSDDDETPVAPTVPTIWSDGQTGQPVGQTQTQVISPTAQQVEGIRSGAIVTCGDCWHFDHEAGQKKMIEERFMERLVREQEWKAHHLGATFDLLGLCGASGGTTVTSQVAPKCDHFRPRRGRLKVIKGYGDKT